MRSILRYAAALAVTACTLDAVSAPVQDQGIPVTVDQVLGEVQKGIYLARQRLAEDASLPVLKQVEVALNTVLTRQVGGSFKILVFSLGTKWEKESVQKLTVELKPYERRGLSGTPKPPLSEQLANAIVGAARGVAQAKKHADVPLSLTKLSVEIAFIVRTEKGGGLKFSVEPVSLELEGKGDMKSETVQKLTVVFEEPAPEKPAAGKPGAKNPTPGPGSPGSRR